MDWKTKLKRKLYFFLVKSVSAPPGTRTDVGWRKWVAPAYAFLAWNMVAAVVYYAVKKKDGMNQME